MKSTDKSIIGVAIVLISVAGFFIHRSFTENRSFQALPQASLAAVSSACSGDKASDKSCWESLFAKTLRQYGVDGALDLLAYTYTTTKAIEESTCHDLTHFIGREAYKIFAKRKSFSVSPKTAYCNYGFFHGVIEGMGEAKKPLTDAKKFCDYIDTAISKEAPEALLQCFHGIGHGAANNHDPRSWGNEEGMVGPALTVCDQISQNREERWRCATGVFHGLGRFYREHLYNLLMRKDDPFWFCKIQLRDEYKETCYRELVYALGAVTDGTPNSIVSVINTIVEDIYANETMRTWSVPYQESQTYRPIGVPFCRTVPERLRISCIQSIARQLVQAGKPGSEVNGALTYCSGDGFRSDEQKACLDFVFYWNSRWNVTSKAKTVCDTVKDAYRGLCYENIQKNAGK